MSRRDTMIVAVLINAGLLVVLFASALKTSFSNSEMVTAPAPFIEEASEVAMKKEMSSTPRDEVDMALSQFAQSPPSVEVSPQVPPAMPSGVETSVASVQTPQAPDFAQDLKMLTQTELPSSPPSVQTLVAPVAPQERTAPEFTEVKVKKGDVLEKIARHHHTTVAAIMKANKLTSTNLKIGQNLKIPVKSIKKTEVATIANPGAQSPAASSGPQYYTVKKGDSPWTIAVKNHIKVEDLLKLNAMSEEQARRLKVGDQIRIQ